MSRASILAVAGVMALTAACSESRDEVAAPTAAPTAAPAAAIAPTGVGWTGLTEPEELIEARRLLMIEIERLMKPIDAFVAGEPADTASLREDATTIEAMLLAFPHLFPPTTNAYDPTLRDPSTIALPTIWRRFDAFLEQTEAAEMAAAAFIAAEDVATLREAGVRLRAACDACHAAFTQPYTPPVVTEEDLNFDFDSVLPPE